MIDNYAQATALVQRMTASVPIPARPTRQLVDLLRSKGVSLGADPKLEIKEVFYGGDEGGIMCDVTPGGMSKEATTFFEHIANEAFDNGEVPVDAKPKMKTLIPPFATGYKKRVYSPNRILYPLKRVDWDPNGERNPQNRGKSKYVRISWDEATEIIASEIKRIHKEYGPSAILSQADGHCEVKYVHAAHGCNTKLLNLMGGYTPQIRNPDSWEGWYWGAKHVWGREP
jgi:anaerobic selenocysteine-containing dehydrogenase